MSHMRNQNPSGPSATEQTKNSAAQVQRDLREMSEHVRELASEKYGDLRHRAKSYYQEGRQRARKWEQSVEQHIQEKPLQSLLMAAGVGMLLGIIWKRRH